MQKPRIKFTFYLIITIILTLGFSISLQSLLAAWTPPSLAAWTPPSVSPPGNNVDPPIYNKGTPTNLAVNHQFTVNSNFYVGLNDLAVDNVNHRVGIGTPIPGEKLDVVGNINIDPLSAYLYDGHQALKLSKGTDFSYTNTFVGLGAGNSTSRRQTAIGFSAGQANLGIWQTAVGCYAGELNSGAYQTALGYKAGYQNTRNYQTALGYAAGYQNIGIWETALGYLAGSHNTGDYQTAVGYDAGINNRGQYQTALGYAAGSSNTGDGQTVLGYKAGYQNTGAYQTAVGLDAGYQNIGAYQTAVGYHAGWQNAGRNVLGIGYMATDRNTADDVVAIGYQAGKNNTVANQFIVKQASINAVPLIQGDFATGNVGIGMTGPGVKLDVAGAIRPEANATGVGEERNQTAVVREYNDSTTCNSSTEGAIRYKNDRNAGELCFCARGTSSNFRWFCLSTTSDYWF